MDINRLKQLSGVVAKAEKTKDQTVVETFSGIKMVQETGFILLAKHFGAEEIKLNESGLYTTAKIAFKESNRDQSIEKLNQFKAAWNFYSATGNLQEAYKVYPAIDSEEYPPINGLEGPFRYESGKVLYYSPKLGKYYDSKTDTYLEPDEVEYHRNPRVKESASLEVLESKMTAAQKAKREEIVMSMKDKEDEFKKKYGSDWKNVMYATATKQALGEAAEDFKHSDLEGASLEASDENQSKKTISEDHGTGFYVMVDGKEICWCATQDEAEEKADELKNKGMDARVVSDNYVKENSDEEDKNLEKPSEEKSKKISKEKESEKVKESIVDNFTQDDTDEKNTLVDRTGTAAMRNKKIKTPNNVLSAINARIAELKKSIELYDNKGYNDHSQKQKAIDCLTKILDDLSTNDLEGLKKAQIFYKTLMSPITDLMPAQLVKFLATAEAVTEQEGKDRASVLKRFIAYHKEQMRYLDKDSVSYKDHAKAIERAERELAQYE